MRGCEDPGCVVDWSHVICIESHDETGRYCAAFRFRPEVKHLIEAVTLKALPFADWITGRLLVAQPVTFAERNTGRPLEAQPESGIDLAW
jgi:hypothetical protein